MGTEPTPQSDDNGAPSPVVLQPQQDALSDAAQDAAASQNPRSQKPRKRGGYKPSHKATFIGIAVVLMILAANAGIIVFVLTRQGEEQANSLADEVVIDSVALNNLGVERTPIGNAGTELIVGPNSRFNGNVVISKDINVAGQFKLNSKFTATSASIAQLETGNVSMSGLTVSGDGTINNLAVQGNMNVRGLTQMQGPVTMAQLLTVNNNVNVAGSLAVGGALAVNSLQINSLTTSGTVTIGGKITTRGNAPSVSPGNALGANGTVSISGNDTAGTVGFNAGTGAGGGIIANVVFRVPYSGTPRVIVSPVGAGVAGAYITRSATGFTIGIDGSVPPGGYGFDYLVIQ